MHLLVTGLKLLVLQLSGRFEVGFAVAFHEEMLWLLRSTLLLIVSIKVYIFDSVSLYCGQSIPGLSTSDKVKIQDQRPKASIRCLNHKLDQLCRSSRSTLSFMLILETMYNNVQFCDCVLYE